MIHGRKPVLEKFGEKYPKYTFRKTSVNNGRKTLKKSQKNDNATVHRRKGRKVKDVVTGARMPAGVISRKMVITIGTGVIKAN